MKHTFADRLVLTLIIISTLAILFKLGYAVLDAEEDVFLSPPISAERPTVDSSRGEIEFKTKITNEGSVPVIIKKSELAGLPGCVDITDNAQPLGPGETREVTIVCPEGTATEEEVNNALFNVHYQREGNSNIQMTTPTLESPISSTGSSGSGGGGGAPAGTTTTTTGVSPTVTGQGGGLDSPFLISVGGDTNSPFVTSESPLIVYFGAITDKYTISTDDVGYNEEHDDCTVDSNGIGTCTIYLTHDGNFEYHISGYEVVSGRYNGPSDNLDFSFERDGTAPMISGFNPSSGTYPPSVEAVVVTFSVSELVSSCRITNVDEPNAHINPYEGALWQVDGTSVSGTFYIREGNNYLRADCFDQAEPSNIGHGVAGPLVRETAAVSTTTSNDGGGGSSASTSPNDEPQSPPTPPPGDNPSDGAGNVIKDIETPEPNWTGKIAAWFRNIFS